MSSRAIHEREGGPAFPTTIRNENYIGDTETTYHGMSRRDYFAAKVLPAIIADASPNTNLTGLEDIEKMVDLAYRFADTMIERS